MFAVMAAHIDPLLRHGAATEGAFDHRFGRADKGHDRAVRRLARVHMEHPDPFRRRDGADDRVDDGPVAAFAVIGDTLDDFFHKGTLNYLQIYRFFVSSQTL